jgi:hypothetical protein
VHQFLNDGLKHFINNRLQPGVDNGQSTKPVLTGYLAAEKPLKRLNLLFPIVTRLKPGANERCIMIEIRPCFQKLAA